jgi:hypothetical protein
VIVRAERGAGLLRLEECKAGLDAHGWYSYSAGGHPAKDTLYAEVAALAEGLGEIVPGRSRQRVEHIFPQDARMAHAGSLSQQYGMAPLPLHTDTAHWTVPCRYLVMACAEPGPEPTPTILLDSRVVSLTKCEAAACSSAVFLIRNGRRSFYGSITAQNRPFIRFDRGCMEPLSPNGAEIAGAFSQARNAGKTYRHDWQRGDILVIDNWRMLHGRGIDNQTASGRLLLRAMVR